MSRKFVDVPNLEGEGDWYAKDTTPILEEFARLEEWASRRFYWQTGKQLCWEGHEV